MARMQSFQRCEGSYADDISDEHSELGDEPYNDVALVVDGRKVYTNSGLLAYNSPVFAELLRNHHDNDVGDLPENDRRSSAIGKSTQFPGDFRPGAVKLSQFEIAVPNRRYKDVKNLVEFLQTTNEAGSELTSDVAFKLFPLAAEYRMSKLKKICGKVLKGSFESLIKETYPGEIPIAVVFKYLGTAEKYGLEKLKNKCIQECGAHLSEPDRREIVEDKHISDKVKIKILDTICDNMSKKFKQELKDVEGEMGERFEESERERKENKDITDTWKKQLNANIGKVVQEARKSHKQLADEMEKANMIDSLHKAVKETTEELIHELNMLKEQVNYVVERVQENIETNDSEVTAWLELRETLQNSYETNIYNIEAIGDGIADTIRLNINVCTMDNLEATLLRNCEMHDRLDNVYAQLQEDNKQMSEALVRERQLETEVEKLNVDLRRHRLKAHRMNTWLKWAKPADINDEMCCCFRHERTRKSAN